MSKTNAEALREAANAWREYLPAVAGYGAVQSVPVWLERRAQWLESLVPQEITYDEVKAGDIIRCDYPGGFSVGIALEKKRLYEDDPDKPETLWKMNGMEYLGQSIGSWHEAGVLTRIPEREVSPLDEEAKGWLRAAQDEAQ